MLTVCHLGLPDEVHARLMPSPATPSSTRGQRPIKDRLQDPLLYHRRAVLRTLNLRVWETLRTPRVRISESDNC